jgi:hypothetical protein
MDDGARQHSGLGSLASSPGRRAEEKAMRGARMPPECGYTATIAEKVRNRPDDSNLATKQGNQCMIPVAKKLCV